MLKNLKKIFFAISLLVGSYIFTINNAFALSTGYQGINEKVSLNDYYNEFYLSDFYYKKSENSFGISGIIVNESDYNCSYGVTASFYDSNYNVVATEYNVCYAPPKKSNGCSQINKSSKINYGYTIDDILYYKLDVEVIEKLESSNNNSDYDYVLDGYNIDIVVNENNTLSIEEKISAIFNVSKHGIYRKIPLKNKITRLDGTVSNNIVKISDIAVSEEYSLSKEDGYKIIKIGNENITHIGHRDYKINYLYNLGKDKSNKYDELYFNIIGADWDTSISNITFTITMPKEFDSSKLGFSSGPVGSTDSSKITYSIDGNVIIGKLEGSLNPNEALTVRLELPDGYFVGASDNFDFLMILSIGLPILFAIISVMLWFIYGRDDTVVETVEFYPPQGLNSLDVGYIYNGFVADKDVVSLLVYLASKGYIKISQTNPSTGEFKIIKLKEYDGNDVNEELFLEGLFNQKKLFRSKELAGMFLEYKDILKQLKKGKIEKYDSDDSSENKVEVTSEELYDNFFHTCNLIALNMGNKKNKILVKNSTNKQIFVALMIAITFCLITIPPAYMYGEIGFEIIFALICPGFGFTGIFKLLFGRIETAEVNGQMTKNSWKIKIFMTIFMLLFAGIPLGFILLPALLADKIYILIYIIGLLCIMILTICFEYLPKRTKYGNDMYGKILGFKNFLEVAEKERLEALVMKDPTFFYDILPYAYVLNVSDKWIRKFSQIAVAEPTWYEDNNSGFSVTSFGKSFNKTMNSANERMASSSASSGGDSSGGSSGGGSSGGGSGGGGGGSW